MSKTTQLPEDYRQRVYAGWLGKCIGVRFGAPLENWTYDEIQRTLGELEGYLPFPTGKIFKPDDDTSVPMVLLRALQDYGPHVSAAQIGETLLNYLGDQHGTLWWGGYGVSTEHTAYLNLKAGLPPPLSGSAAVNGLALSEQIGGQIFSDIWGLVAPSRPGLGADLAEKAASVSHDGNGVYGGRFIAACTSAAFDVRDPHELVRIGLEQVPAGSEYERVVRAVCGYHREDPHNWRRAFLRLREEFGYQHYPGMVPIIPNAGVVVLALLYGAGDFSQSIKIANMAGWDTDCNVGNVGAIVGTAVGLEGIEWRWRTPLEDILVTASVVGTRNLLTLPECAHLIADLGEMLAGAGAPSLRPRLRFDLPGATCGARMEGSPEILVEFHQAGVQDEGALALTLRRLTKKSEARLYFDTYLRSERLSSNYYGASFTPKIHPGQTLRARLYLPPEAKPWLYAGLFAWDDNHKELHQGGSTALVPGEWTEIEFRLPALKGACLGRVGVAFRTIDEPWSGQVFLGWLDWDGAAQYSSDFGVETPAYGAISGWTYLRGYWRLEGGAYHGSGTETSESYSGDVRWQDYRLTARLVPLFGDAHLILGRVQGALRGYAFGLGAQNTLRLYKKVEGEYRQVASKEFEWQSGETYELQLQVQGRRLSAGVKGGPAIDWVDEQEPYLHGQIGLASFPLCHTRWEGLDIEPVE